MKTPLLTAAALAVCLSASRAAIPVSGSMVYTQDFNVLDTATNASTSTKTWVDDSTIPGWILHRAGAGGTEPAGAVGQNYTYRVSNGEPGLNNTLADTGHFYSMGALNDTDRGLGAVSKTDKGEHSIIAVFQNTSGRRVRLTQIRYQAEVWRSNQNQPPSVDLKETIFFSYRKAGTQADFLTNTTATATVAEFPATLETNPSGPYLTGWTRVPAANYTRSSTDVNLRYDPAVTSLVDTAPDSDILVEVGEFLAVRWGNINDKDADAIMGIDDVALTFTAEDTGISAEVTATVRDDATTPRVPGDDTVNATVLATSTRGGTNWIVTAPPSMAGQTGSFGAAATLTGIPVSAFTEPGHRLTVTIADQADATSFLQLAITAPWCQITAQPATGFTYLDKGTPDTTDDEVSYTLNASGVFTGDTVSVSPGGGSGAYDSAMTVTVPAPGTFVTHTFTDSADAACTGTLVVFPSAIIGTNSLSGTAAPLKSVPVASSGGVRWTANAAIPSLVQNANPINADHVMLSESLDLSTVGSVEFTAQLVAAGTGTGFEAEDSFALELLIDGVPVNGLGSSDTPAGTPDGRLRGGQELSTLAGTSTFNFKYRIPQEANSVQLQVTGNSNSTGETFTLRNVSFAIPQPAITVSAPANLARQANGPGDADDTFTFDVTIGGSDGGAGWVATGATPPSGAFGPVTFTIPASTASASATVTVSDDTFPAATKNVTVALPLVMGTLQTAAGSEHFYTAITPAPAAQWVASGMPATIYTMNGVGLAAPNKTVESETITVAASTAWNVSANLHIRDLTSGFEAGDNFDAYVIVNGDSANPVSLITAHNTGGGTTLDGPELCPEPTPNPSEQNFDYPLSAVIPAGATSLQIVFTGLCNSANENMILSNWLIAPNTGIIDSDGDGVSDTDEDTMGTLPNDASSVLRLSQAPGGFSFPTVAGVFYRIYASSTTAGAESSHLQTWIDTGTTITGDGSTATVPVAPEAGVPRKFFRLHVKRDDLDWPAQVP